MIRRLLAAGLAAGLLAACASSEAPSGVAAIQPREGRSGLLLSGTVDGRQVAVNDGAPVMRLGDCDVNDGPDTDLCFVSREVDGGFFSFVVENPDVLEAGEVPIVDDPCRSPRCDEVTDGAVVEVQFAPGTKRMRAEGGALRLVTVESGRRYAGTMNVILPQGRITGTFEVVPRPEEP